MAHSIKVYGDIPSVRRMCRELNKDNKLIDKLVPVISDITKRELELKKQYKTKYCQKLQLHHGKFVLSFT